MAYIYLERDFSNNRSTGICNARLNFANENAFNMEKLPYMTATGLKYRTFFNNVTKQKAILKLRGFPLIM